VQDPDDPVAKKFLAQYIYRRYKKSPPLGRAFEKVELNSLPLLNSA
jgi:hypothetical protein